MTRELYIVLLTFGDRHRAEAWKLVHDCAQRLFPGPRPRVAIVDNRLGGDLEEELDLEVTLVSGDNSEREFSGWDRGLAWIERAYRPAPDSVVVIANDTFHRDDKRHHFSAVTPERAQRAVRSGGLFGWVDAYPRAIELWGMRTRHWVDTSFFAAELRTLSRARPFKLPFADEEIFGGDAQRLFREPSPLSANYRSYLRTWLFGEPGEDQFAESWYAQSPLRQETFASSKQKIRTILCEHYLSARARAAGIELHDSRAEPIRPEPC